MSAEDLIDEATVQQHTWTMRNQTDEHIAFIEKLFRMCKSMKEKATAMGGELEQIKESLAHEKEARTAAEQKTAVTEQALKDKTQEMSDRVADLEKHGQEQSAALQQQMADQKAAAEAKISEMDNKIADTIKECAAKAEETQRAAEQQMQASSNDCQHKVDELNNNISNLNSQVTNMKEEADKREREWQKTQDDKENELKELRRQVMASESTVKGVMFMRQNVDAFHIASGYIQEPVAACMLPDGCVLIADTLSGLLMYSPHTELIQKLQSETWKWPQGIVYDALGQKVQVSCMQKQPDGSFRRVIMTFLLEPDDLKLYHKLKESEILFGPPEADVDTHVAKEKLARSPTTGDLYLSLADNLGSALYKYAREEWSLLTKRQGATFSDLQVLSQTGPITEVLVVESRMGYIHKLSVRGKDVASRSSIAVVEKPSCIAVDQLGQLFCQDIISGKVHGVNSRFEVVRDICLIDDAVFSITASHGYLGVALREQRMIRIYKYESSEVAEVPEAYALST